MYENLNELNYFQLKTMAIEMGLKVRRSKKDLIISISKAFDEYNEYKKDKLDKYKKSEKLGEGKEGTTYIVKTKSGNKYAMKTFRKQKSSKNLRKEAELQQIAASVGISPNVVDIDTVSKYIVMDLLDRHLWEDVVKKKGLLEKTYQKQIISIFKKLDECGVFHADANVLNYMIKGKKLYIIDFGMAKQITSELKKKLKTNSPNMTFMTLGLILKLKEMNCMRESYSYLARYISDTDRKKFEIL
jgi:tRNA A-37 threonylcarbamoyl transferase component Bud32